MLTKCQVTCPKKYQKKQRRNGKIAIESALSKLSKVPTSSRSCRLKGPELEDAETRKPRKHSRNHLKITSKNPFSLQCAVAVKVCYNPHYSVYVVITYPHHSIPWTESRPSAPKGMAMGAPEPQHATAFTNALSPKGCCWVSQVSLDHKNYP